LRDFNKRDEMNTRKREMVWSKRPYRSKIKISESIPGDSAQDARDMKCQKSGPREIRMREEGRRSVVKEGSRKEKKKSKQGVGEMREKKKRAQRKERYEPDLCK
jgi:hypothetical protein